jgi:hypothetical protein
MLRSGPLISGTGLGSEYPDSRGAGGSQFRLLCVGVVDACVLTQVCYLPGSERGSPNCRSTLVSKRVMALIWLPERVSTSRPVPWRMPL